MSETQSRISPVVAIAAVSVIIFSAVGVGVMTGVIPSSLSKNSEQQAAAKTDATKAAAAPAVPEKKTASATPKRAPVSEAPKRAAASEPVRVASAPSVCTNCGTVESVNVIEQKGEGSGLGAVAGGVAGALLGNQVGGGSGRKIATVAGAAGGAYAGHQVEKQVKSTKRYDVAVRMQDGTSRSFSYDSQPSYRAGDKVKVVEGTLVAN
ncbi:MAG: glycine zipper 2TM domain-containing protein [Pseudomonadota bacterium]